MSRQTCVVQQLFCHGGFFHIVGQQVRYGGEGDGTHAVPAGAQLLPQQLPGVCRQLPLGKAHLRWAGAAPQGLGCAQGSSQA